MKVKQLSGEGGTGAEEVARQLYLRNVSSSHSMPLAELAGEEGEGALGPLPAPCRMEGEIVRFHRWGSGSGCRSGAWGLYCARAGLGWAHAAALRQAAPGSAGV